jgi:hypothetical protein
VLRRLVYPAVVVDPGTRVSIVVTFTTSTAGPYQ